MKYVVLAGLIITATVVRAEPTPNVLFIVSDDHGWGDLPSNWDKTEARLPTLDALAAQGVRFSNYHTVPLCGPSRACMFTGQYSSENGMWRGPGSQPLGSPGYRGIKRDVKMLSEYLSEAGYKTGAFGKWHMGALAGEVPNDRGFEEFRGFLAGAHPYWITEKRSKIMHNRKPDSASKGHATELFTGWAEQFIRKSVAAEAPFFCYLAYNAVHGPLRTDKSKPASAPKEWVDKALARGVDFLRSDYVAILEHMDHNIGKLVSVLNELGVSESTLIVFVSDNGGCTMEKGAAGGRFPGNNGPFRGGKGTTYQGGLNVPFLMNWKGRLPQGMVSKEQVMHCDVYATLLDAAGIPVPKTNGRNPVRGISLMPHMLSGGKQAMPERSMIFELWGNVGLRKGNYKLRADVGRDHSPDWKALVTELKAAELALFDLGKDVAERKNLREDLPEVYDSLKKELIDHFAKVNDEYPTEATHPDRFVPAKKGSGPADQEALEKTKPGPAKASTGSRDGRVAGEATFWYEDNNVRKAGGYPDDFREMFENPDSWSEMRSKLSVYCIRGNTLKNVVNDLGEEWVIKHFCGLLKKEKIPVAIDNPSPDRIPAIKLLQKNGIVISHLALQSVLSKFKAKPMSPEQRRKEIGKRIEVTVPKLKMLRKEFPQAKIGIIDALPPKGIPYAVPYKDMLEKSHAAGAPIQFIHVDAPYSSIEKTIGWENLSRLQKTISRDLELEFGMIVTDNVGGMKSNKAFYDQVMRMGMKYPKPAFPDYFILMSWYPHPKYAVREAGPQGKYTMTRTALDFFNLISDKIDKDGRPRPGNK